MTKQYLALLETAEAAARAAGELAVTQAQRQLDVMHKGDRDIVTQTDFDAQRLIVDMVHKRFPAHGFVAEEEDGALSADADTVWIIDPIDGTSNFSRGVPLYCISIAAAVAGEAVAGVVYDPVRDEMFGAAKGCGATLNGKQIAVSNEVDWEDAIIGFDWSRTTELRSRMLRVIDDARFQPRTVRSFGAAALEIAWVACGRIDAYLNFSINIWDIAAAALIVSEAGGRSAGTSDRAFQQGKRQGVYLAANQHLFPALKQLGLDAN